MKRKDYETILNLTSIVNELKERLAFEEVNIEKTEMYQCNFCGAPSKDVNRLVVTEDKLSTGNVAICDHCIEVSLYKIKKPLNR